MQKRLDFYHNYSIRILDSLFTHLHKEENETWGWFDLVFLFYDIVFSAPLRERGERGERVSGGDGNKEMEKRTFFFYMMIYDITY